METVETIKVNAKPTKDFFISVLIRDVLQVDAIIDLVDNCVDGALRLSPTENYKGLWVRIEVGPSTFRISDNCGGMSVEMVSRYAFRFGRAPGMEGTPHSVGQFGVGMKRALFKLGKAFSVESRTQHEYFKVDVDVDQWKADPDLWEFDFADVKRGLSVPPEECGTTITVSRLNADAAEAFGQTSFAPRLAAALEAKHQQNLAHGLTITINQIPVQMRMAELLHSDAIQPLYKRLEFPPDIKVKLYAGISDSNPSAAGWYAYCNGRLVIGPDQTIKTGWGEDDGVVLPKYHNQFARFRGYVFFDSDEAVLLPWNTSKTDIDSDSRVYKATRLEMVKVTRTVIDFLNNLDREKDDDTVEGRPLEQAVNAASRVALEHLELSDRFEAPKKPLSVVKLQTSRISYSKPTKDIRRVMARLKARTFKEVGERTFDHYLEMECGEE